MIRDVSKEKFERNKYDTILKECNKKAKAKRLVRCMETCT